MDLWEICLTALQHLTARCPSKIKPYHEQILHVAQKFLTYDPNYSYADSSSSEESKESIPMQVDDPDLSASAEEDWGDNDEGWGDEMEDEEGAGENLPQLLRSALSTSEVTIGRGSSVSGVVTQDGETWCQTKWSWRRWAAET